MRPKGLLRRNLHKIRRLRNTSAESTFCVGGMLAQNRWNDSDSADCSTVATAVQKMQMSLPQRHKEHREKQQTNTLILEQKFEIVKQNSLEFSNRLRFQ